MLPGRRTVLGCCSCGIQSALASATPHGQKRTAENNSRTTIQLRERKIQNLAAHIIKIHIELRRSRREVRAKARALVVDDLVGAELAFEPRALLGAACDGDDARAGALRKLAHDVARRARGARDDECLARFQLRDVKETL